MSQPDSVVHPLLSNFFVKYTQHEHTVNYEIHLQKMQIDKKKNIDSCKFFALCCVGSYLRLRTTE